MAERFDGPHQPGARISIEEEASVAERARKQRRQSLQMMLTVDERRSSSSRNSSPANTEKGVHDGRHAEMDEVSRREAGKKAQSPLQHVRNTGLEFEDLTYTVMQKRKNPEGKWIKQEIALLQGITGVASKGQVTAVMGPSGAGKSTLLDALAGRIASGSLGGIITVNGRPVTSSLMKRMSAYVMQEDQLFPKLTVWETMWFAAEVRLPQYMSLAEKRDRVVNLIDQLGLTNAQNTYIGDETTRGISGGEKRRVSIGVDIIHGPALLFLDEPTSGLDSTSAFNVIEKIHTIAAAGSTVLLTIHQPSYRIQQLLNRLIILARGQQVYSGSPSNLSTHLAAFGREVPRGEIAIEYFLDVIQDYDKSTFGLEPLVQFNVDGVMPDHNKAAPVRKVETQSKTKSPMPDDISFNSRFKKSPPLGYHDYYSMDASQGQYPLETGNSRAYESFDDDYGHSVTRERAPKLAAFYYSSLIESLAGMVRSPVRTPLRTPSTTPSRSFPTIVEMGNSSAVGRNSSKVPVRTPDHEGAWTPPLSNFKPKPTTKISPSPRSSECSSSNGGSYDLYGPKFANSWLREVLILMLRNIKNIQRTPELFLSRQAVLTFMGFLTATLFVRTRHELTTLDGVTKLLSFSVFSVCSFFFTSNDAVPAFIMERFIFIREASHNAYRASSYVLANAITSVPFLLIQALTYTLITWWALGSENLGSESFIFFVLVLFVSLLCTGSFVMLVSALVPDFILAYTVVIAVSSLFFLASGYFLKRESIPTYWVWLHYISTIKYPYEALLQNEFDNPHWKPCYFPNPDNSCALNGASLLQSLSITQLTKYQNLGILFSWAVFYRILFYLVLRFASKNQRT